MANGWCYNEALRWPPSAAVSFAFGEWLSLVEHLVRDQGVGGSNPLSPTNSFTEIQAISGSRLHTRSMSSTDAPTDENSTTGFRPRWSQSMASESDARVDFPAHTIECRFI